MTPMLGIMASQISGHLKPVVTGGTLSSDTTYYYRAFTSSGTLGITGGTLSCDVLVVAGGGSGSGDTGGGGGA